MASNSESGFNFTAPKPRASSEHARLDAVARGKKSARTEARRAFFGSISDLSEAGELKALDPTIERAPPQPRSQAWPATPKLELDRVPDAFFDTVAWDVDASDGFELPSSIGEPTTTPIMRNEYPEPSTEGRDSVHPQLSETPSRFYQSADADRALELEQKDSTGRDDTEADMDAKNFDFDFGVPSVLGEQPVETTPVEIAESKARSKDGYLAIPPSAAAIARPAADSSCDQPTASTDAAQMAPRRCRSSNSRAGGGNPALGNRPETRDAKPRVFVFPQIPASAELSTKFVPRALANETTSPTRRDEVPERPHRAVGCSPRPRETYSGKDPAPLAAIRRKTTGSHAAVADSDVLVPFRCDDVPSQAFDKTKPADVHAGHNGPTSLSEELEKVPLFDDFDYPSKSTVDAMVEGARGDTAKELKTLEAEAHAHTATKPTVAVEQRSTLGGDAPNAKIDTRKDTPPRASGPMSPIDSAPRPEQFARGVSGYAAASVPEPSTEAPIRRRPGEVRPHDLEVSPAAAETLKLEPGGPRDPRRSSDAEPGTPKSPGPQAEATEATTGPPTSKAHAEPPTASTPQPQAAAEAQTTAPPKPATTTRFRRIGPGARAQTDRRT